MISCHHCDAGAVNYDADEGASFKCESCGILGKVVIGDRDVGSGDDVEAVAYLYFRPNKGARCSWDGCEECTVTR